MLLQKKTAKLSLETEAKEGAQDMEKRCHLLHWARHVLDSKHSGADYIKQSCWRMTPFCSIYDVNIRNIAVEYRVGVGEDPSGKKDFILIHPPYLVR